MKEYTHILPDSKTIIDMVLTKIVDKPNVSRSQSGGGGVNKCGKRSAYKCKEKKHAVGY